MTIIKSRFFGICIAMILMLTSVGAADTGNNPWLDSRLMLVGAYVGNVSFENPASGGDDSFGINTGVGTNIDQTGDISVVQFGISNCTKITRFHILIWRYDSTSKSFTCVGKTENLAPKILTNGVQNITIDTKIPARSGDFIGWESDADVAKTQLISTSIIPDSANAIIHHGTKRPSGFSVGDNFDFVKSAGFHTKNKIFRVNIFMTTSSVFAEKAKTAVSDIWTDKSLSCAAPYIGNIVHNSPASGGDDSYGINTGKQTRIRQNGQIKAVQFGIANYTRISRFHILVWRHDGNLNTTDGTFTCIAKSENLANKISSNGIQNIVLNTPLNALEGDYIGWESDAVGSIPSNMITTSAVPSTSVDVVIHHGIHRTSGFNVGEKFDFAKNSNYHTKSKIFRINVFMDRLDTAFIGDSIISGRTNHTGYVDPALYWQPESSMSYQWGLITGRSYQNLGWRGQTTNAIKARFVNDVISLHPRNVVIEGGINDYGSGIAKEVTLSNMKWMVNTALSSGIHPIVIEIPPSEIGAQNGGCAAWDWINNELAKTYDNDSRVTIIHIRKYVGTTSAYGGAGNLWKIRPEYDPGDRLHYNIRGYQEWARVLSQSF